MAKHLPFSSPQRRSLPTVNNDTASILQNWKTKLTPVVKRSLPSRTPANFAVTNSRGGLKLTWSPVQTPEDKALGSPDGYEILKSASGTFTSDLVVIPIKGANVSEYFDSLGGSAQTASYRIRTTSGTSSNPQSQRGPESGVVSHTSLDAADTTSVATTIRDKFANDKTRSLARLGNYGAIQNSNAGIGTTAAATGAASSAATAAGGASQSTPASSILFSAIGSGTNNSAQMVVGLNASITPDPNLPGVIAATNLQTIPITTGVPTDQDQLRYNGTSGQLEYFAEGTSAVRYVSPLGSDSESGRTWGRAKATIAAAIASLPTVSFGALSNAPYGTIYLGAGTYVVSSPITVNSPLVHIIGVDVSATIISCTASSCFLQTLSGTLGQPNAPFLSNLTVQGNASASQIGLSGVDADGIALRDVRFTGFSGTSASAISLTNNTNETERLNFTRVSFDACTVGITMIGVVGFTSFGHNTFIDLQFSIASGQEAFSLSGGAGLYKSVITGVVNTSGAGSYTVWSLSGAGTNVDASTLIALGLDNSGGGTLTGVVFGSGSPTFRPWGSMNGASTAFSGSGTYTSSVAFLDGGLIDTYPAATGFLKLIIYATGSGTTAMTLSPGVGLNAYNFVVNNPASSRNLTLADPGGNDQFVFRGSTDIFTNKTFDTAGAGNVLKINGTQLTAVTGSGSAVLATSPSLTTPSISGSPSSSTSASALGGKQWRMQQNVGDEANAGVFDYANFDGSALSIVGAGTVSGSRKVHIFDNLVVDNALTVNGGTPTGSGGALGLGNTTGFGNGAAGTAVTTTLLGTGSGPATPQTVVKYLEVDLGGTKYWVPLVQ